MFSIKFIQSFYFYSFSPLHCNRFVRLETVFYIAFLEFYNFVKIFKGVIASYINLFKMYSYLFILLYINFFFTLTFKLPTIKRNDISELFPFTLYTGTDLSDQRPYYIQQYYRPYFICQIRDRILYYFRFYFYLFIFLFY